MAIPTPASNLSGLALRLVREGFLPAADAERLQNEANTQKLPLISHLVSSKKLNSGTIAKVASEEFGVPLYWTCGELETDGWWGAEIRELEVGTPPSKHMRRAGEQ